MHSTRIGDGTKQIGFLLCVKMSRYYMSIVMKCYYIRNTYQENEPSFDLHLELGHRSRAYRELRYMSYRYIEDVESSLHVRCTVDTCIYNAAPVIRSLLHVREVSKSLGTTQSSMRKLFNFGSLNLKD